MKYTRMFPVILALILVLPLTAWALFARSASTENASAEPSQIKREPNKGPKGPMLAHMVYFSMKNKNDAKKLVDACKKHLTGHPGEVFFGAGLLAADLDRPVNDRDWDVALHIVFADKASHDRYQDDKRHLQFIEENKASWKKVRVFDSYVER